MKFPLKIIEDIVGTRVDGGEAWNVYAPVASDSGGTVVVKFAEYSDELAEKFITEINAIHKSRDDLLAACKAMRDKMTDMLNNRVLCWRDWPIAYDVDAAIAKAEALRESI